MPGNTKMLLFIALCALLPVFCFSQGSLSLDDYLSQVEGNNPDIKASRLSIDSVGRKILELDMVYSPYFTASYNYIDDKSGPGYGSTLLTNEIITNIWNFGLSKKFGTGSTLSLGYTNMSANISLLAPYRILPFMPPLSNFTGYDLKPILKIDQSLLRDFMSAQTNAGINKLKSAARSGQYLLLYKIQLLDIKARSSYLMLSLAREILSFRQEEVERAEKIVRWTANRVNLDLADKGDLLQVQGLYKLRKLNLQVAVEDEKNACREFNETRGVSDETVKEELEKLSDIIKGYKNIASLSRKGERADVLSAKASFQGSEYAKIETKYRSYPELGLSVSASLHGLDLTFDNAAKQVTDADKPTYAAGLFLLVPLDAPTLSKVRKGYELDYESSRETLEKAQLSEKNDWIKLVENWENVKARLDLAVEIKKIQTERLANEQQKFERGRTTTFQLLNAENDLDDATINVYRLTMEELLTYAQAELYNTQELK